MADEPTPTTDEAAPIEPGAGDEAIHHIASATIDSLGDYCDALVVAAIPKSAPEAIPVAIQGTPGQVQMLANSVLQPLCNSGVRFTSLTFVQNPGEPPRDSIDGTFYDDGLNSEMDE